MSEDDTIRDSDSPEFRRIQELLNRLAVHAQSLEAGVKAVNEKVDRNQTELEKLNRNVTKLSQKVDLFHSDLTDVRITSREHEERLAQLESDGSTLQIVN